MREHPPSVNVPTQVVGSAQVMSYTENQTIGLLFCLRMMMQNETGAVIMERDPNSDSGWIEVLPTKHYMDYKRLAIWKATGDVYEIGAGEAIIEPPLFMPEFRRKT